MAHFFEDWLYNQSSASINNEVIEIFEESIKCYKIGAYRAAIVMAFNGFQIVIKNRIIFDKKKMIDELNNRNDNKYKNLIYELNNKKLDDEDTWDKELQTLLAGEKFNTIFNVSNKNTISKEWEIWRSRRNTGAHGKSYKLISADVESFYSWIIQSLNILYPFTHINNILDEINKYFSNKYEYSNDKPVDKLLNDIIILEDDNLNKVLDKIYNYYNNRNDKRILYIFKELLYNEKSKKTISNFFFNKLNGLEDEQNIDDIIILEMLLYDANIIYAFDIEDLYVLYSKIINRIKISGLNYNKQNELMSIFVNILLKNNNDMKNAIEDNIIKDSVNSQLTIVLLYVYYQESKDIYFDKLYNNFKNSINYILKSSLMKYNIDDISFYVNNMFPYNILSYYNIYNKDILKEIRYKLISLSDKNELLTDEIIECFSYELREYLYSNRNTFNTNTNKLLYNINIGLFNDLINSNKNYYGYNDILAKIFWKYLTCDELKYFINIMNVSNFIYDYYVTYEYFTEKLSNEYKEKYPDIDFSKIENGRKKALQFCKYKNYSSNCGFNENIEG